jgi:hypothetical protein
MSRVVRLVASMPVLPIKTRGLLAAMAFSGLAVSSAGQIKLVAYPYRAANYGRNELRIFPSAGDVVTITLPFHIGRAIFGPDGRSLFGINEAGPDGVIPSLLKVEFNPTRLSPVPGTTGFVIKSFAFSARQDKLVISGKRTEANRCGVFEILLPAGNVKQILNSDCGYQWAWDDLSMSPDGGQAVATVGSNRDHDLHLELIDLVHGTTKRLSKEFEFGVWSPDGKWIAMLGSRKISLLDAHDFRKRRALGRTSSIRPAWSPDSRYLLLWKFHLFRCGFSLDVDAPATLVTLDIESRKRSTIRSSQCQLTVGSTGWLSSDIAQ